MRRLAALAGLVVMIACVPFGPASASASALAQKAAASKAAAPVRSLQHLVVMTQGGRSFDNLFGARPGVNGIPARACQLPANVSQKACVTPRPLGSAPKQQQLIASLRTQLESVHRGAMNGFVRAQAGKRSDGSAAMGYFRPGDLPLLNELAGRGVIFDDFFSGVPGGTVANRLFGVTARPPAKDPAAVPTAGWPDQQTIFDRLTNAGIPWKIYVQNYESSLTITTASTKQRLGGQVVRAPVLAMPRFINDTAAMSHVADLGRYYSDLVRGTLPAVSYIVTTSATEQSPQSPVKGNQVARAVVNGLIASTAWSSSAFLLQYDSSGGWYDHVQPPRIDGATVGLRVPALMISPFVTPGTVDHDTLDAASTLKLIERTWNVAPLAQRDRDAGDLGTVMRFGRAPSTRSLVGVPSDRNVLQPDRALLYIGYLGMICMAALVMAYVIRTSGARRVGTA